MKIQNLVADYSQKEKIQKELEKRASTFDIIALLRALMFLDYQPDDILFQSHYSSVSATNLVEKIEFRTQPIRQAVVWLNMGLLSVSTPLPAYFFKSIDKDYLEEKPFLNFLGFFDHKLLQMYLYSIYPEMNTKIYPDWEKAKRSYMNLLGINSLSFVHWIFNATFPELGLQAERKEHQRELSGSGIQIGGSHLGSNTLGSRSQLPVSGFDVRLYSFEEDTELGVPWASEVKERMKEIIFPVLRDFSVSLKVILVIESQKVWAMLRQESYLGVDRIRGGKPEPRQISIFQGIVR